MLILTTLSLCMPGLFSYFGAQANESLRWPLLSPDALAWTTLILAVGLASRASIALVLVVIPIMALLISGLIAFALPAYGQLAVVLVALFTLGLICYLRVRPGDTD
jgi:hypothetical protein